jgi:hypothetical protein
MWRSSGKAPHILEDCMDLVSFKLPTHLTRCYPTGGWVDLKHGWNDMKYGKFLALMGVKLQTSHSDKADI